MEFEVPKRHIVSPTLFIVMVQQVLQRERQKTMIEKCCFHINTYIFILQNIFHSYKEIREKEGEWVKHEENSQKSAHPLFGVVISLGPCSIYT